MVYILFNKWHKLSFYRRVCVYKLYFFLHAIHTFNLKSNLVCRINKNVDVIFTFFDSHVLFIVCYEKVRIYLEFIYILFCHQCVSSNEKSSSDSMSVIESIKAIETINQFECVVGCAILGKVCCCCCCCQRYDAIVNHCHKFFTN